MSSLRILARLIALIIALFMIVAVSIVFRPEPYSALVIGIILGAVAIIIADTLVGDSL